MIQTIPLTSLLQIPSAKQWALLQQAVGMLMEQNIGICNGTIKQACPMYHVQTIIAGLLVVMMPKASKKVVLDIIKMYL